MIRQAFDSVCVLDQRYFDPEVADHLSEAAFVRAKLRVELALVEVLRDRGICPQEAYSEIRQACGDIQPIHVAEEELLTKHDIRALVNCIQARVSDRAKQFVHLSATSYDIVDTANALRYRGAMEKILLPRLETLQRTLGKLAIREAATPQVGRTHGQHASPITFGFAIASYVHRLGSSILALREHTQNIVGKFSGAVGAYNASSLLIDDPIAFEADILRKLDLAPAEHSTQIVPPEPIMRLLFECIMTGGVLAQIARDMRHLQRSEIAEVGEVFEKDQVGSSTMPHKRNPISFENVESMWIILVGRIMPLLLNQVSEHQRDLTNSASGRTAVEIIAYLVYMTKRLNGVMRKLVVDTERMRKHLDASPVVAEPLYILLAREGHPDAHEAVRRLTLEFENPKNRRGPTLILHALEDAELAPYIKKLNSEEFKLLSDPAAYTGKAFERTVLLVGMWEKRLFPTESEIASPDVPM